MKSLFCDVNNGSILKYLDGWLFEVSTQSAVSISSRQFSESIKETATTMAYDKEAVSSALTWWFTNQRNRIFSPPVTAMCFIAKWQFFLNTKTLTLQVLTYSSWNIIDRVFFSNNSWIYMFVSLLLWNCLKSKYH